MSQTDPIAELLTRIRNAMHARYNQVEVPHSRMREAICRTLSAEGF
jgi:small subunit ribosomal protein S8